MKRFFCTLMTAFALAVVGIVAPPALADGTAQRDAAATAVAKILAAYSGGLFGSCPVASHSGNCWWWAADTFMALIDYAEVNGGSSDPTINANITDIETDLSTTYQAVCNGTCPTQPDEAGTNPFNNSWYDDMGWWEQTWINAYKLTGLTRYLNLAEQLWNNVTDNGITSPNGPFCGLVIQQTAKPGGLEDGFANSLYFRDSAWLYAITGNKRYMDGNSQGGGAHYIASLIRADMIEKVPNTDTLGNPGARFMIAGHTDKADSCGPVGSQMWLTTQGEMVNAWSDMSVAQQRYCSDPGNVCATSPGYYSSLADELATTISNNQGWSNPPTIDGINILSEPCTPSWPNCDLGDPSSVNTLQPFLIFKGNFERGAYCSYHQLFDQNLKDFIANNANHIAMLSNFGFRWDDSTFDSAVVNFATRASILDGLDAAIGGSQDMCAS